MKQGKSWLLFLCTLLLLGLGLGLPRLTAAAADRRLASETLQRENVQVSLVLSSERDLFDMLTLFATQQTQITLTEGAQMTTGEAQQAACELRAKLAASHQYGPAAALTLPPEAKEAVAVLPQVTPILITGQGSPTPSGIFWRCVWEQEAHLYEVIWLDDQTGQLVAFQTPLPDLAIAVVEADGSVLADYSGIQEHMALAADFLRLFYNVDEAQLSGGPQNYSLLLRRGPEGQDDSCALSLVLWDDCLYFNC